VGCDVVGVVQVLLVDVELLDVVVCIGNVRRFFECELCDMLLVLMLCDDGWEVGVGLGWWSLVGV